MKTALVTLTLVLGAATPAGAAAIPGFRYGGGDLPGGYTTKTASLERSTVTAAAAVAPDGVTVRMRIATAARCGRNRGSSQEMAGTGQIGADGHLRMTLSSRAYGAPGVTPGPPRGRGTVDVAFDGPNAAGTVRIRVSTRLRGRRLRCDSGDRAFVMRAAAPGGQPTAPPPGGTVLYGSSSSIWRGAPTHALLRMTRDGRKIAAILIGVTLRCGGGHIEFLNNLSPPASVRADGSFTRPERYRFRYRDAVDATQVRLRGRFTSNGASGTISVTQVTRNRAGRVTQTCRSGRVDWAAAPA